MAIPKLIQETRDRLALQNANGDTSIHLTASEEIDKKTGMHIRSASNGNVADLWTTTQDAFTSVDLTTSGYGNSANVRLTADAEEGRAQLQLNTVDFFNSKLYPNILYVSDVQLRGLQDPTDATDAATKNYVDTAMENAGATGTITGVSINGESIATSGTADIPKGTNAVWGAVKLTSSTSSSADAWSGVAAAPSAVKSAYDLANAAMPKSGGTFTGAIQYNGTTTVSSTTGYYRPIRVSTVAPTAADGNVGDIWIQYS